MKRLHRRAHALIWLLLLPFLIFTIYWADTGRLAPPPAVDASDASAVGVLP
ncbi:MAG: hypothetical protein AAGI72_18355 [Pseudomonadota bacterium]